MYKPSEPRVDTTFICSANDLGLSTLLCKVRNAVLI